MTLTLLNTAQVDLAESVLQSPKNNPLYLFFGTVKPWESNWAVISITQANPAVVKIDPSHDIVVGDVVTFNNVVGMTAINGLSGSVTAVSGDQITVSIDTSAFAAYVSGGFMSAARTTKPENTSAQEVKHKIAGLKVITGSDMCHVIPRQDWIAGTVFDYYDPNNLDGKKFYAHVNNRLYICLENAGGVVVSNAAPTGTSSSPITMNDGYTWQYVQTISNDDMLKFGDANWLPVRPTSSSKTTLRNGISAIHTVARGTSYKHDDPVTIVGDGEGATAIIRKFFSGGLIYSIMVTNPGKNYTWASAYVTSLDSSGSGAKLKPQIGWGFGPTSDPVHDMNARHIKFVVEIDGDEDGQLYVGPVRSVGMLRPVDGKLSTGIVDARSSLKIDAGGTAFTVGMTITGQISGTTAFVAGSKEDTIYYLEEQGSGFLSGEIITATANVSAVIKSVNQFDRSLLDDANIIYIDNLSSVLTRNVNQVDKFVATIGY